MMISVSAWILLGVIITSTLFNKRCDGLPSYIPLGVVGAVLGSLRFNPAGTVLVVAGALLLALWAWGSGRWGRSAVAPAQDGAEISAGATL